MKKTTTGRPQGSARPAVRQEISVYVEHDPKAGGEGFNVKSKPIFVKVLYIYTQTRVCIETNKVGQHDLSASARRDIGQDAICRFVGRSTIQSFEKTNVDSKVR